MQQDPEESGTLLCRIYQIEENGYYYRRKKKYFMEKKRLRRTAYFSWVWLVILACALVTATYAWFTFNPATNVTPMGSTISEGDTYLLIANRPEGEFAESCELILDSPVDVMRPLSTADLSSFYTSVAQNRNGISILFEDVTDQADSSAMHGKVYLKCEGGDCRVYFFRPGLALGGDLQTLAALRLGMKITTLEGSHTYMFRLDALGDTGSAAGKRTVPTGETVVSSVGGSGSASFVPDPAVSISEYMAVDSGADDREPREGNAPLCTLQKEEIATVEYWLYLEGCDDNCIGEVQSRDMDLQLAFAGVGIQ